MIGSDPSSLVGLLDLINHVGIIQSDAILASEGGSGGELNLGLGLPLGSESTDLVDSLDSLPEGAGVEGIVLRGADHDIGETGLVGSGGLVGGINGLDHHLELGIGAKDLAVRASLVGGQAQGAEHGLKLNHCLFLEGTVEDSDLLVASIGSMPLGFQSSTLGLGHGQNDLIQRLPACKEVLAVEGAGEGVVGECILHARSI